MKAEYINPFYQATYEVFQNMLDLAIERGPIGLVEEAVAGQEVNAIIGVTGSLSGSVLFSFPKEMVLEIVHILSGMKVDKLDTFVTSAVGEIANIISGNALTALSKQNYLCDIVPPQIVLGNDKSLSMVVDKALYISLNSAIGKFSITISVKEKP